MESLENLNWIDLVILGIFLSSVLLGAWRGFFAVVFGVLSLLTGFLVAQKYALSLVPSLSALLGKSALLTPLAYVLTFFIGFSVFGALTFVFRRLFRKINLGGIDTFIGGLFGALRGWLLVVLLTLLLSLANINQTEAWHRAVSVPAVGASLRVAMKLPFLSDYQEWLIYDEKNRPLISLEEKRIAEQSMDEEAVIIKQRDKEIDSVTEELVEYSALGPNNTASQMAIERYEKEKINSPLQALSGFMEYLDCEIRERKNCDNPFDNDDKE